jgi:hypothetical protein
VAHKITVTNIDKGKPDHVVEAQAAATLSIGDGELGIFIGTGVVADNNQRCISALQQLRDALRESNFSDGAAADNYAYVTPPDGKPGITVGNGAAIPALTEDEVAIAYGGTFYDPGNSSNFSNHINRLIQTFQEKILRSASTGIHAFAAGVLTGTTIAADDTVTVAGVEYTFLATPLVADDIDVGADDEESLDNLIAAINAAAGEGTKYGTGTVINPDARAAAGAGDTMDVIARRSGTAGNAITTTAVLTAGDFAAATLLGGL